MKYTNKHIKEEYKLNQIGRTIGMILLVIGILLVGFGLIQTKRKMECILLHLIFQSGKTEFRYYHKISATRLPTLPELLRLLHDLFS